MRKTFVFRSPNISTITVDNPETSSGTAQWTLPRLEFAQKDPNPMQWPSVTSLHDDGKGSRETASLHHKHTYT